MVSELGSTFNVSLPERAFAIWADYWIRMGFLVPPIVMKRYGLHSDIVFYAPMGRAELESFIAAMKKNEEIVFLMEGEAQIFQSQWFGHWCAFSAAARSKREVPIYPPPLPKVPRSIWFP